MRWLSFVILPLVLAITLVLLTRPRDTGTTLSPANISLGADQAAAAPQVVEAQRPPVPPPQPAGTRADSPPVAAPAGDGTETFDLRRAPSIDAPTIGRILQSYGSPAVGAADTIYALGVRYGIDPAFCLAFFIHESTAGTAGVARVTKSVGNIRTTPGYRDYQGYRSYDSWEEGIDDWYRLISDLYIDGWRLTTVDAIVPVYAPSSDGNNPDGYIATVKSLVAGWRT